MAVNTASADGLEMPADAPEVRAEVVKMSPKPRFDVLKQFCGVTGSTSAGSAKTRSTHYKHIRNRTSPSWKHTALTLYSEAPCCAASTT